MTMTLSLKAAVSSSAARKGENGIFGSEVQEDAITRQTAARHIRRRSTAGLLHFGGMLLRGSLLLQRKIFSEGMTMLLIFQLNPMPLRVHHEA
jgi:hypothetical protein